MRAVECEDRPALVGRQLGQEFLCHGAAEAAARRRPEGFGNHPYPRLAQMGGQHLQVFACHAGGARVHADSILEKHAHIFRYPAHDPVNQRLGAQVGIVIGADPQRTRQLVENFGEKTGRSPGRIDFDREVPAGNPQWQRRDRRFQGI